MGGGAIDTAMPTAAEEEASGSPAKRSAASAITGNFIFIVTVFKADVTPRELFSCMFFASSICRLSIIVRREEKRVFEVLVELGVRGIGFFSWHPRRFGGGFWNDKA